MGLEGLARHVRAGFVIWVTADQMGQGLGIGSWRGSSFACSDDDDDECILDIRRPRVLEGLCLVCIKLLGILLSPGCSVESSRWLFSKWQAVVGVHKPPLLSQGNLRRPQLLTSNHQHTSFNLNAQLLNPSQRVVFPAHCTLHTRRTFSSIRRAAICIVRFQTRASSKLMMSTQPPKHPPSVGQQSRMGLCRCNHPGV